MRWIIAAALLTCSLGHVAVQKYPRGESSAEGVTLVARALVRTELTKNEVFYLSTVANGDSAALSASYCSNRDRNETAVYFGRSAYMLLCDPQSSVSYASIVDFDPDGPVTLTKTHIEFKHPNDLFSPGKIAETDAGQCGSPPRLELCPFSIKGTNDVFYVSESNTLHRIPQTDFGKTVEINGEFGSFVLDAQDYNSFLELPDGLPQNIKYIASLDKTGLMVHWDGASFSLWKSTNVASDAQRLFSMLLMVCGAIIFVRTSMEISAVLLQPQNTNDNVLRAASIICGGDNGKMHVIMYDFSTTALAIAAYQYHLDGKNRNTFDASVSESYHGAALEVVTILLCGVATVATVWGTAACRAMRVSTSYEYKAYDRMSFVRKIMPARISAGHVLAVRLGYEYCILVGFLASSPQTMGVGYSQVIYIMTCLVFLTAVGRDMRIWISSAEPGETHQIIAAPILVGAFCFPLVSFGIFPIIDQSHSFPATPGVTEVVSACIGVSAVVIGALSRGAPFGRNSKVA